jgi:branched-chain amino acid transport system substrate-binding protein
VFRSSRYRGRRPGPGDVQVIWRRRLSRRTLLRLGAGALSASLLHRPALAFGLQPRVGLVLPTGQEEFRLTSSSVEFAGAAARKGAVLAVETLEGGSPGVVLELLQANAPDEGSALRAARRLAGREEVFALVGGLGEGQAEALTAVASEYGLLFLDVGSTGDAAGEDRNVFHLEAGAGEYLAALARWFSGERFLPWAVVHPDSSDGRLLGTEAAQALGAAWGAQGSAWLLPAPEAPAFDRSIAAIREERPGLVVLLLDWRQQLEFLGRFEAESLAIPVTGFPWPATQTHEFTVAAASGAPRSFAGQRIGLWHSTLRDFGAGELNDRFLARWGAPMDSPAWSAYAALVALGSAVSATGSTEAESLAQWLEGPEARFDIGKGEHISFQTHDHRLRQPLFVLDVDPSARVPERVVGVYRDLG